MKNTEDSVWEVATQAYPEAHYIGIELNPEYAAMSERRIVGDAPLFNGPTPELIQSPIDFGEAR